jgi:hypothetical protein
MGVTRGALPFLPREIEADKKMEVEDIRRLLVSLLETASSFKDPTDVDNIFGQAASAIGSINDPDDQAVAQDLCLRGPTSLFTSARAAKDRGRSPCAHVLRCT